MWSDKSLLHANAQGGSDTDYPLSAKRESLFFEVETPFESQIPPSRISLYGQDPAVTSIRSSVLNRASGPVVTQVCSYTLEGHILKSLNFSRFVYELPNFNFLLLRPLTN